MFCGGREYYVSKKKVKGKSKTRLETVFITEASQLANVAGPATDFTVLIDPNGEISDYDLHEPVYWELEVKGIDSGYYARFFLEVE